MGASGRPLLAAAPATVCGPLTGGDARLLERSVVELREAQLRLDTARAALVA